MIKAHVKTNMGPHFSLEVQPVLFYKQTNNHNV